MNLLIVTQKVDKNDSVLGFFHSWIEEFAKHFENVNVVCLEKGNYSLPHTVAVFSLGKERYTPHTAHHVLHKRLLYSINFYKYIWLERKKYDTVFVHMNPEYVILGGLLWRLWGKKIGLWYVHRAVNLKLRIAEKFTDIIFSTTPEAFRLRSKKVHFLGHGIQFSLFPRRHSTEARDRLEIVHVGRITRIKNLGILIMAASILKRKLVKGFRLVLAGAPTTAGDIEYERELKGLVKNLNLENEITFFGAVPFARVGELYREADISVNLTPSGGMDKAVLESIASGTLALSSNKAFRGLFGKHAGYLLYDEKNPDSIAEKIIALCNIDKTLKLKMQEYLYERVKQDFKLEDLIKHIVALIKNNES